MPNWMIFGKVPGGGVISNPKIYIAYLGNFKQGFLVMKLIQIDSIFLNWSFYSLGEGGFVLCQACSNILPLQNLLLLISVQNINIDLDRGQIFLAVHLPEMGPLAINPRQLNIGTLACGWSRYLCILLVPFEGDDDSDIDGVFVQMCILWMKLMVMIIQTKYMHAPSSLHKWVQMWPRENLLRHFFFFCTNMCICSNNFEIIERQSEL